MYLRLELRLPYKTIVRVVEEQFDESISQGTVCGFVRDMSAYYAETERAILTHMRASPAIHVDETRISVQGTEQYVWVFTDGRHTIFRLTKTRETAIVEEVLGDYGGVLVSDFYAGYDALPYQQQKCLVHLIRDMNEDLWDAPFDRELGVLARLFRDLLTETFEAIDRYGFKRRHLQRFVRSVEEFYRAAVGGREYSSDIANKYQRRFDRYRQSLFTFLSGDSIPWNNNAAERAIRCLVIQRKISGTFYESLMPDYLRLLGVAQTCRAQDRSLLSFLSSGETDIDAFAVVRRRGSLTSRGRR
jgi:hypothetical protein